MTSELTLECDSCHRRVNITQERYDDMDENPECEDCGGTFYEAEDSETYTCDECDSEYDKSDDLIFFTEASVSICKKCIDKKYPRQTETVTKVVEKIVEKPIIKYVDNQNKEVTMPKSNFESTLSKFD